MKLGFTMFFECIWQPIEFEVCLEHRHPTSQRRSTQPTETPLHSIDTYGLPISFNIVHILYETEGIILGRWVVLLLILLLRVIARGTLFLLPSPYVCDSGLYSSLCADV